MSKQIIKKYKISILRPAGNDTALIEGTGEKEKRKSINDEVMKTFPNVEQVGFYNYDPSDKKAKLEMADGEFCGNATRSLAYLLFKGKKGEISITVSGTKKVLKAGVKKKNTAYAQMPIVKSLDSVTKIDKNLWLVDLEGISHLIKITSQTLNRNYAKRIAKQLLKKTGLLSSRPAAGVMFVRRNNFNSTLEIEPVVWVRDIQTLFYETACASGTAAIGLWRAKQTKEKRLQIKVKQPSGQYISVAIQKSKTGFQKAVIDGPVKILGAINYGKGKIR